WLWRQPEPPAARAVPIDDLERSPDAARPGPFTASADGWQESLTALSGAGVDGDNTIDAGPDIATGGREPARIVVGHHDVDITSDHLDPLHGEACAANEEERHGCV